MSIYLPTYQPTKLSIYLPTYQPTNLPTYLLTILSIYLPIYLSTYQTMYLPTYQLPANLSLYLTVYLSTSCCSLPLSLYILILVVYFYWSFELFLFSLSRSQSTYFFSPLLFLHSIFVQVFVFSLLVCLSVQTKRQSQKAHIPHLSVLKLISTKDLQKNSPNRGTQRRKEAIMIRQRSTEAEQNEKCKILRT